MFSELPKLLGKNFAIGFFLPAAILFASSSYILNLFQIELLDLGREEMIPVSLFLAWVLAIIFLAVNRPIVRILEGYGRLNPLRFFFEWRSKANFRDFAVPLIKQAKAIDHARMSGTAVPAVADDFPKKYSEVVSSYPDEESWVIATKFGNIMRAFEVYSRVVYGIDAIPAWPRLMMVIPKQAREQIQDGRALLDFSVNVYVSAWASGFLYVTLAWLKQDLPQPWILGVTAVILILVRTMVQQAALQWGQEIKSAFDLYRELLAQQLKLQLPLDAELERDMWQSVSRMMIFRSHRAYAALEPYRMRPQERSASAGAETNPDSDG